MSKVNLKKEAKKQVEETEIPDEITEEKLLEECPQIFLDIFKKSKSIGNRADFLYEADEHRLECQKEVEAMKKFLSLLERWFIQQLPEGDATGIAGEIARVQIKHKERPNVTDWDKFYAHIAKTRSFELLNRAPNAKSMKERWENGVTIPGVEKFSFKDVSVTKIK